MIPRHGGASPPGRKLGISALALVVVLAALPFAADAEIPHENYDLASSDLDTVIALLNSSIRSSEEALRGFYSEDLGDATQYLDRVGAVLVPAKSILSDIEDVVGSYEELNSLLPPFVGLYDSMEMFLGQETSLLSTIDGIVSSSELENLTGEALVEALDAIEMFNSLIVQMNHTIDEMLAHAHAIDGLTLEDSTPFVPNELVELIEQLRDKIDDVLTEVQKVIEEDIPWDGDISFIILWVSDASIYLGDSIVGGGYVFLSGAFAEGHAVEVDMDEDALIDATTGSGGRFAFSYPVPVNETWLGPHTLTAYAEATNGTIASEPVAITISLIPTTLTLSADKTLIGPEERVRVIASLKDAEGSALPSFECSFDLDGDVTTFVTDDDGGADWSWTGAELGFGTHSASASFAGVLPYASSTSGTVDIQVDIPTNITLTLFSDRLRLGYYIVGEGRLVSNDSDPMPSRQVSLYVDDEFIQYARTGADGTFAFSIGTDNMTEGAHTLRASFDLREPVWRYSEAEVGFVILSKTYMDYPFFPWIPGWNIGFGDIPYLFFGENAYYTWLLIVLGLAVVVKAMQVRKARRKESPEEGPSPEETSLPEGILAEELGRAEPERAPEWLPSANEKVVWHYNRTISFLRRRRRIGIEDNMTHWEVARLLQSLGYPENATRNATILFEKAFYSSAVMSEADVIQMGSSAHMLKRVGGARPAG